MEISIFVEEIPDNLIKQFSVYSWPWRHCLIARYWLTSMRRCFTIYSAFLAIKNSISWYQEMNFWYQEIFFISRNIFWYQEFDFLIFRNGILDIKNSIFWYQEFDFLISRNNKYFLISRNRILDIKKSNSKYQKMHIFMSRIRFLDIKK